MNIFNSYTPLSFKSRCPEIKLGQQVCHIVNTEFPHSSTTKLKPLMKKHMNNVSSPAAIMNLICKINAERPYPGISNARYYADLFRFTDNYKCFNCFESAKLSELILKLNGISNSYTANIHKGHTDIDHAVCFFNRDGSEYDGNFCNKQTIIVDPWTGICDFSSNILKEYEGWWSKYFNTLFNCPLDMIAGSFRFNNVISTILNSELIEEIKYLYPNLILKNNIYKKG